MSTGIRIAAPTPKRQTRISAEAIVYGRRKAKSTIDMIIEVYAQTLWKVASYQFENNGVIAFSVSRKPTRGVGVLSRMSTMLDNYDYSYIFSSIKGKLRNIAGDQTW